MSKKFFGFILFAALLQVRAARAGDISWSGLYRIEYFQGANLDLSGNKRGNSYFLQHLILDPKIIVADGLTIHSRFDLFNNCQFGQDNQAGQFLGDGITNSPGCNNPASAVNGGGPVPQPVNGKSNVFSNSQSPETLQINELYLTWAQEFGVFVAGRTPLQFGLGMTYSAGNGPFDHFLTNEDMIAYKLVFGNLMVMPMFGKVNQGSNDGLGNLDVGGGITDYMLQVEYDNPETDLQLGVFGQFRVATAFAQDTPAPGPVGLGGVGGISNLGFKSQNINAFTKQKFGDLSIGIEFGIQSGNTGAVATNVPGSPQVTMNGFGFVGELGYAPKTSGWAHMLKFGMASGDNPGTDDRYEGFTFNRNYDVALLMFNHPLGRDNFLRTQLIRDTTTDASNNIDNEAISNAVFIAPSTDYKLRDNLSFGATLLYASLLQDPLLVNGSAAGTSKNLGFETDFRVNYKPYERFTWLTEIGLLFPGAAWQGASYGYGSSFAYGFSTKAAISF